MAYEYHLQRLEMAFKRAALSPDADIRAQAHYDLAQRLKTIIERSLTRDDTIQKQRKKQGIYHNLQNNFQAQNSLLIDLMRDAKIQAATEAARLNPTKFNAADATLII